MIRSFITTLFIAISFWGVAQGNYPEAEVMFQSRHIWRGTKLGTAPAIEPSVTFSKGHFSLNAWASITTNNSYSEIDLIPAWQFGELSVTVLDYYNPVVGEENQFFNFQEGHNRHSLELTIDNYSGEKHRLKWLVGAFYWATRMKRPEIHFTRLTSN